MPQSTVVRGPAYDPAEGIADAQVASRSHLQTVLVGITIPIIQSMVSGMMLAFVTGTVLVILEISPWKWSLLVFALSSALSWFLLLVRWVRLHDLEQLLNTDINRDGFIGEPVEDPTQVIMWVAGRSRDGSTEQRRLDWPVKLDVLQKMCAAVIRDPAIGVSENQFAVGRGKIMTLPKFRDVRAIMIENRWLVMRDPMEPRQGFVLTDAGRDAFERIAGGEYVTQ